MIQVVQAGHRYRGADPGHQVAGKTGTAETGDNQTTARLVHRPRARRSDPQYTVAVLIEHGGTSGADAEVTGGRVAAPVAAQVLRALARGVTECNRRRVGATSP